MDLDTKWKSVRESRWFKALCVVLSMVLAFSSVALLSAVMRVSGLYNNDAFTDPSVAKREVWYRLRFLKRSWMRSSMRSRCWRGKSSCNKRRLP